MPMDSRPRAAILRNRLVKHRLTRGGRRLSSGLTAVAPGTMRSVIKSVRPRRFVATFSVRAGIDFDRDSVDGGVVRLVRFIGECKCIGVSAGSVDAAYVDAAEKIMLAVNELEPEDHDVMPADFEALWHTEGLDFSSEVLLQ